MIAASSASGSLENGSSHPPEIKIGGEMTEANTSLGSLRICVDRESAYEQNEMPTPRVEPLTQRGKWRERVDELNAHLEYLRNERKKYKQVIEAKVPGTIRKAQAGLKMIQTEINAQKTRIWAAEDRMRMCH